jgi:salicylate hydroxylase
MPSFEVAIVGAGIVGLAASIRLADKGHKVVVSPGSPYKTIIIEKRTNPPPEVIEATQSIQVVGDGIAVAANSQRVLKHYSILDDFYERAARNVGVMQHRSYITGEVISTCDMTSQV